MMLGTTLTSQKQHLICKSIKAFEDSQKDRKKCGLDVVKNTQELPQTGTIKKLFNPSLVAKNFHSQSLNH